MRQTTFIKPAEVTPQNIEPETFEIIYGDDNNEENKSAKDQQK